MKRRFTFGVLLLLALVARPSAAQTCTLTDTSMNFGTYTGALLDGTSTGRVTCAGSWNIPLNAGSGAGATETLRKMTGPGGAELSYEVFQDAARTINWGNTTGAEMTGTGNTNITFYGQILAGQYVVPGTYTDTLSTDTTNFSVTATVAKDCSVTATNLAFGNYTGAQVRSTSTITTTCTSSTTYTVGLNAGTATGATVTNRSMTGPGSALLHYSLFSNSGYTTDWGNTSATNWVSGTGTGSAKAITVYGQIPAAQYVKPGSYTDTITVSVTY